MSNIDEVNALINKLKDEELEDGSLLIISVKPVEKYEQKERAKLNSIVKGSRPALTQSIASMILGDPDMKQLITEGFMLAVLQDIERDNFVENILKNIK